jgi:hypothetical protein
MKNDGIVYPLTIIFYDSLLLDKSYIIHFSLIIIH